MSFDSEFRLTENFFYLDLLSTTILTARLVFSIFLDDAEIKRSLMGRSISQIRPKNYKYKRIRVLIVLDGLVHVYVFTKSFLAEV